MTAEVPSTTVRLSVFVDPSARGRALAALSETPVGASRWQDVSLDQLDRPLNWDYAKLLYLLSKESSANATARRIGRNLYELVFCGDLAITFARARAAAGHRQLRICVDASDELIDVPWELLHDGNDFLFTQNCSIIRVAAELPPDVAYFGPLTRLALVSVTPDFNAQLHLDRLAAMLNTIGVRAVKCENPSRQELQAFLASQAVDALYFLGHGKQGHILVRPDGESGLLSAGDLASWFPERSNASRRVNLVYLNSCGTAERRPDENVFSGVAQRLMLSGRVGTVVAMQAKIGIADGFRLAEKFLEEVVHKGDPEAALFVARTGVENICARSIPVLYTHVKGPEEFRRNRLSRLLAIRPRDKVGLSLAALKMGVKPDDYEVAKEGLFKAIKDAGDPYYYRGRTYAQGDVHAAKELLDLLTEIGPLSGATITSDDLLPDCPTVFFFGSRSHRGVEALVHEYARHFNLEGGAEVWAVVDLKHRLRYELKAPTRRDVDYYAQDDWGIIEKATSNDRCYFFLCGLGDRATRGCAYFLGRRWEELLAKHQDRPFAELLRFPGQMGEDFTRGELIDRAQNDYGRQITSQ